MCKEKSIIAKNGIPIYSYTNRHNHSFFISLFLRAGSMYEDVGECGITHFLEHISIRNINHLMGGTLYALLDKYGIEFNASTYSDMVQFYISGASAHFGVAAEIVARLLCPISLPKREVDAERSRIKAEIREVDDKNSLSAFTQRILWEGTSLAEPITGSISSVNAITARRLESYRKRVFTRDNLFFYITGNVSESDIDSFADLIGGYPLEEGACHVNVAPVPKSFFRRDGAVHLKSADFTKIRFSFDIDMTRVTVPECDLLYDTVFGGYNSRFFIELSENRGLFYDLNGAVERYGNIGSLSFSYELREQKLYEAVERTVELLSALCRGAESERSMKASYVDNADMLLDEPRELNFTFAYDNHILSQGYTDLESRKAAYAEITEDRLRKVASEIFRRSNLTVTVKGNKRRINPDKIKEIIQRL